MCYYLTLLEHGPGRRWLGGGSKWCEPTELWLSLLSRSTPWASRDGQRARCGLVLLWPCQNKYTNEHTCSQLHTVKHTRANINNDTDRKPTCTGLPLPRASRIQLSMSKDSLPFLPFSLLFSLSLPLVSPLSSPVAGVELLISTAMNTLPKDGEDRRLCVFVYGSTISVSSADSWWRLAEDSFSRQKMQKRSILYFWQQAAGTADGPFAKPWCDSFC